MQGHMWNHHKVKGEAHSESNTSRASLRAQSWHYLIWGHLVVSGVGLFECLPCVRMLWLGMVLKGP